MVASEAAGVDASNSPKVGSVEDELDGGVVTREIVE